MKISHVKHLFPLLLLIGILFIAFWIRLKGADTLPPGQFLENDGYFYYWQAQTITEHGKLPPRDMHRWMPIGRDNGLLLSLYPYVVAYTYKAIALFSSSITLYHVCLYMPSVCFVFGLGILCLFLYSTFGAWVANATGILLATLPSAIGRSTVGFGDRDMWCLMVALCVVIPYLIALQTASPRKRIGWTLLSGGFTVIGGLSWEGFGAFLLLIYILELYRFLTSEHEIGLLSYLLWVCSFVPALYLLAPAYRRGDFFATHLFAFMLVPPVAILVIRAIRHLLLTLPQTAARFKEHSRKIALGLTIVLLSAGLGYFFMQLDTLGTTTILTQTPLMQTVSELNAPDFVFWTSRYGSVFIFGSLALCVAGYYTNRLALAVPLCLFTLTTFARQPLSALFGETVADLLFFISISICCVGGIHTAVYHRPQTPRPKTELPFIVMAAWFVLWIALSRDAMRYDVFIGVPIAFFTAIGIKRFAETVGNFLDNINAGKIAATTALALILFWAPVGGHARFSLYAATQMRTALPGPGLTYETLVWMRTHLKDAVVAAHWRFGSQLNVIGDVKTLTDQDHYIPPKIYQYNQHVHRAATERGALIFLKTHKATHLLQTPHDPQDSFLNRNPDGIRFFRPLYPKMHFATAPIKLYEIQYPPDIKADLKYLGIETKE